MHIHNNVLINFAAFNEVVYSFNFSSWLFRRFVLNANLLFSFMKSNRSQ